jgi:carboxypeptidase C (cathepsin A)
MNHIARSALAAILLAAAGAPALALAADPTAVAISAAKPTVVTEHEGVFNGETIRYRAIVESTDAPKQDGAPGARVVSISYVAETGGDTNERPVLFVFNGGPIAASIWLHMGAVGPKRVAVPDDLAADPATFALADNPYSPLDAADLVFFDPAGTGFSDVLPGAKLDDYFSVAADGQQLTAFIVAWLTKHDRLDAPIYLLGESYGTMRAAEAAAQLAELPEPLPADGVFLMGQAVNIIEYAQRKRNIISYAVSLPTLAAIAFEHGKGSPKGRDLEKYVWDAWDYGRTDYLTALFQGDAIGPKERARVAKRLEEYSGIPASYYEANMLRITKEQFRVELLKDQNLLIGRNDGRYAAPITEEGGRADPFSVVMPAFQRLFTQYLTEDLKVDNAAAYNPFNFTAGIDGWDWGAKTPFSDWPYVERIGKAFDANPDFHVVIGNGYHDTQTTIGAAEYAATQSGWPKDRVRTSYYPGGHMAYTIEKSAKAFGEDIRLFVKGE